MVSELDTRIMVCRTLYKEYNRIYFQNKCPEEMIFEFRQMKRHLGFAGRKNGITYIKLNKSLFEPNIQMGNGELGFNGILSTSDLPTVLLHEMTHIYQQSTGAMMTPTGQFHCKEFYDYLDKIRNLKL